MMRLSASTDQCCRNRKVIKKNHLVGGYEGWRFYDLTKTGDGGKKGEKEDDGQGGWNEGFAIAPEWVGRSGISRRVPFTTRYQCLTRVALQPGVSYLNVSDLTWRARGPARCRRMWDAMSRSRRGSERSGGSHCHERRRSSSGRRR